MTEAPPKEPAAPPSALRRSSEGRFLMGVCAGLGRHTGIDPVVFRVGFVILLFGSGIGLYLYIAAYLLMKEPNGRPGLIEQWTHRDFDADTVMALMTAVLALGLGINLSTVWLDTGTLVAGLFLAVALLAAHAHGVDLLGLVRSMPERLNRRPPKNLGEYSYQETPRVPPYPQSAPTTPHPRPYGPPPPGVRPESPAPEPPAPSAGSVPFSSAGSAAVHADVSPATPSDQDKVEDEAGRDAAATGQDDSVEAGRVDETVELPAQSAPGKGEPADQADVSSGPGERAGFGSADGTGEKSESSSQDRTRFDSEYTEYGVQEEAVFGAERVRPSAGGPEHRPRSGPFAPHGPYQPLDPARRGYSPYDPALYAPPAPPPRPKPRTRPRSYIGAITMLLATIIGGFLVAVQAASPSGVQPTIVGGAVLVTIGAGLLIAAWWGKGAGLVAAGTMVALLIGVGLMFGGLPAKVGRSVWVPVAVEETRQVFDVGLGDGTLDLTELALKPGSTVEVETAISVGTLDVIVPPDARVEVHATNKVGDVQVDQSLRGGVDVRFDKVLEPEVEPEGEPATIVLTIRGGVGDVEVRRGA